MREIQFRGKLIKNNKWVCGDLIHDTQNNVYVYPLWSEGLYIGNRVLPDTVGQFTGLHDKNGTDISRVTSYIWTLCRLTQCRSCLWKVLSALRTKTVSSLVISTIFTMQALSNVPYWVTFTTTLNY